MSSPSLLDGLTVRQLHSALAVLRGGSIGFDPFRNPETNSKDKVIQYMLNHYSSDAIASALQQAKDEEQEPARSMAPAPAVSGTVAPDDLAALAEIMGRIAGNKTAPLDETRVRAIAAEEAAKVDRPVRFEVKNVQGEVRDCGIQHERFLDLLRACNARLPDGHRLNVWLKGPAGSGKTTAAKEVSKALGMQFYSNGAIDTKFELTGFINAAGTYIPSIFRKAWENGGIYLFDEVDASNPQAVTCFNAALANGFFAFPDGMIARHPDLVVIAGANTSGNGATSEYVGRMKQDAAFLDRFVQIEWNVDEKLERAICGNEEWTKRVQSVRRKVSERGIKGHLVTPRASLFGEALLAQGLDIKTVELMVLKKGLAQDAWDQVR